MGAAFRKDINSGRNSRRNTIAGTIRQSYSGINNFAQVGKTNQVGTGSSGTISNGSGVTFPLTPTILDVSPGATINIDLAAITAHHIKIELTENLTITLSNPPTSGSRIKTMLEFIQDATGGWTVTFPGSVTTPPTVPSTPGDRTVYELQTIDAGTTFDIFESLITNTVAGSGANTALDNLITTNINASLIPQAGKLLGSSGNEWARVHTDVLRLGTAGTISAADNTIIGDSGGTTFNIPTGGGEEFDWQAGGVSKMTFSSGGTLSTATFRASAAVVLDDAVSFPGTNGSIYREGSDVKVFTGDNEINLSNVAIGTLLNTDLSNLAATTSINSDLLFNSTGFDIGNTLSPVDNLFVEQLRFISGTVVVNRPMIFSSTGNILDFNFPTGSSLQIREQGVAKHSFTAGTYTAPNIIVSNTQTFSDSSFDPNANGMFSRNGSDLKVFSGGALRNLSDIGVAAGGANVNLSNLSTVAINADLKFNSTGFDIGDSTNFVEDIFVGRIRLQSGVGVANKPIIYTSTGNILDLNFPTGSSMILRENNISKWTWTAGTQTGGSIILNTALVLNDAVSFPGTNGSIYREGADVKVFTGGLELNLSSIGSGGADAALSNLASVAINTSLLPASDDIIDLGSGTKQWRDLYVDGTAHIDTLNATIISGTSISVTSTVFSVISGTIVLGDSTSDNLSIQARINSNIIPDSDDTYDLGSSSLQWRDIHIDGTANIDRLSGVASCATSLLPPNDTHNLGGASNRWINMFVNDTVDFNEGFAAGFAPTGSTNRTKLFTRPNGVKTQFRVKFQTGTSILIAEEP